MKKLIWGSLFALVFLAGMLTTFTPTAAETCCGKMCAHGNAQQKSWQLRHQNEEVCCRKESCLKK